MSTLPAPELLDCVTRHEVLEDLRDRRAAVVEERQYLRHGAGVVAVANDRWVELPDFQTTNKREVETVEVTEGRL